MNRREEFVLRTIEERDIRFVELWFTGVLGTLKSVAVAPASSRVPSRGGSASTVRRSRASPGSTRRCAGQARPLDAQVCRGWQPAARPDVLRGADARRIAELRDPRHVLQRALDKAANLGFTFYTPRSEFFLLKPEPGPDGRPVPVDDAGCADHMPRRSHDFRRAAITMLENMGISVEFGHHEGAPGQGTRSTCATRTPSAPRTTS